jgi:hypothetical protein
MCANTAPTEPSALPAKARPLVEYLRQRVREEGDIYVKSRFVAEDIDLSSKQIGSYMRKLQDARIDLTIEAWAYTNGTTWHVTSG